MIAHWTGGGVNALGQLQTTPPLASIANRRMAVAHGGNEIGDGGAVGRGIADLRRTGALVAPVGRLIDQLGHGIAQVGAHHALALQHHRAGRAGELDAALVAGVGGGGDLEGA